MKTKKHNRIDSLQIIVVSDNNYFYEDLKYLLKSYVDKFKSVNITLEKSTVLDENIFNKSGPLPVLFFIDFHFLLTDPNRIINKSKQTFDIIVLLNKHFSNENLANMKQFIENNSLNLLGNIATENFTPSVTRYLTLDFILQKINESN